MLGGYRGDRGGIAEDCLVDAPLTGEPAYRVTLKSGGRSAGATSGGEPGLAELATLFF